VVSAAVGWGGPARLSSSLDWRPVIETGTSSPTEDTARLLAEARKNAQLVHTNIVQVYDIIEVDAEHLIVMEYVDGPSLYTNFRETARMGGAAPLDRAIATLKDILAGVAFAHSKNICHRDLSPLWSRKCLTNRPARG